MFTFLSHCETAWSHIAPLFKSCFVLEFLAPNSIANIKKTKFEMMKFWEYKCC